MGTRLNVHTNPETVNYYGSKHYGYTPNCENLESFRYLQSIGVVSPDANPNCPEFISEFKLSSEEFKTFIAMYDYEFAKACNCRWPYPPIISAEPAMIELLNNSMDKYISWL